MKKLLSSVLLLLGLFSFVSSSLEVKVSAAVVPPNASVPSTYVAPRAVFDVISPDDELVLHMMEQVADVDPRFNNLSQYDSLAYFITIDTVKNDYAGYMWERDMLGGYKFYIIPHVGWGSTYKNLTAEFPPTSSWQGYSGYHDPKIRSPIGGTQSPKNAWFATDWSTDREAYVYGYTFDADGVLDLPISRALVDSTIRAFDVRLSEPLSTSNVSSTSVRTLVVRGNLGNMPSYYRIPALDNDLLDGDGGSGGDDDGGLSGLWNNIVSFFTGLFDGLWNNITGFFSVVVDFFANITDWVIGLFVPDEEFFADYWAGWDAWMEEKFGLAYQGIEIITGIFTTMMTRHDGNRVINLGNLFGGNAHIDYGALERYLPELFTFLQFILRAFTVMVVIRSATNMLLGMFADREIE